MRSSATGRTIRPRFRYADPSMIGLSPRRNPNKYIEFRIQVTQRILRRAQEEGTSALKGVPVHGCDAASG